MRRLFFALIILAVAAPLAAQPAIQSRDGKLAIIAGESGPRVVDERGHSNPILVPDEVRIDSLAPIRAGWVAAGTVPVETRQELYLRMLDAGGLKRLPNPHFQEARFRMDPVILTKNGFVVGLVWLEGESRDAMGVFSSHWLGITWSRPQQITDDSSGGALAVDATQLEDGSWLVTWAGFDGEDDEIYWSLVIGETATSPVALTDNEVPDILPTVTAVGQDALLAWNHFDGEEYRVRVVRMVEGRFDEGWSEPRGTFEPLLLEREGVPTLLYFNYQGGQGSWDVTELDGEGTVLRRARTEALGRQRPVVRPIQGDAHLEWTNGAGSRRLNWADEE